jgi:hypothetical protein
MMPREQGRRYLAWVKAKAFLPNYGMTEEMCFPEGFRYRRRINLCQYTGT